jgi:hypothetical protein
MITISVDLLRDLYTLARDACNARRDFARDTLDPAAVAAADAATATIVEAMAYLDI